MAELPEQNEAGEPNEDLIKVFDTEQESEAMVVRGLLEANGIPAVIENLDAPQDVLPAMTTRWFSKLSGICGCRMRTSTAKRGSSVRSP